MLQFHYNQKEKRIKMTYTYSFDRVSTISPLDFITEQNNEFEENNSDEFDFDFLAVDNFDPDEIL